MSSSVFLIFGPSSPLFSETPTLIHLSSVCYVLLYKQLFLTVLQEYSPGVWDGHVHTALFKMDNQQRPAVEHRELCSTSFDSLGGRGVWGRMDACICKAESLHCSPETTTTLLIAYTPNKRKSSKEKNNTPQTVICPTETEHLPLLDPVCNFLPTCAPLHFSFMYSYPIQPPLLHREEQLNR